jgi:lipopolysaccharide transport system permease protein
MSPKRLTLLFDGTRLRRDVSDISSNPPAVRVLTSGRDWISMGLRELVEYHELLYFLVWRDIKVRYKQSILGAAWAILQPFMTMVVFTIFFNRMAGVSSGDVPYPLFSYAGLLPWTFFAQGLSQSSNSLVGSANLIRKVYFPRVVVPIASILSGAVDFALAFVVLVAMMAFYGVWPTAAIVWFPLFVLLAFVTALGVGLWLAALNVEYRDIRYVVPFVIQLWLFVTPVIYPSTAVVAKLESSGLPGWLYGLNPMAGVVEGFRWALFGGDVPGSLLLTSGISAVVLLAGGAYYFWRVEETFADVV